MKTLKKILRLHMQFFAEGAVIEDEDETAESDVAENSGGDPNISTSEKTEQTEKTFTQSEVDKIIADRLAREAKKAEKRYTKEEVESIVSEKLSEAEKVAKMNAEQKAKYAQEKLEKELAQREADLTRRELTASAKEIFAEKGLPVELAEIVDTTSAENCTASIETVEKAFSAAVQKAVNDRLKAYPPKSGNANKGGVQITSLAGALHEKFDKK